MRLDILLDTMSAIVGQERQVLRRVARYVLPPLLLPIGFALAQAPLGGIPALAAGLGGLVLMAQAELFLRPTLNRARTIDRDLTFYLGLQAAAAPSSPAGALALLAPSAVALVASMALFLPPLLEGAAPWQRVLALALGVVALYAVWQRLAETTALIDRLDARLSAARAPHVGRQEAQHTRAEPGVALPDRDIRPQPPARLPASGLLDPALSRRVAGLPLPPLRLSPAATALLRVEAYLALRDFPGAGERALIEALGELGRECYDAELRHAMLPPVGGKIYLPVAAGGTLASLLSLSARALGMDGTYSGSLQTWLVRLPPARSYVVAGRLIDAVVALGLPPPGSTLPHHLTVQGDLGGSSWLPSLAYLASAPLLFAARDPADRDERPFIMRGGGVLDDLAGRGRGSGPRTDFIDGFIFAQAPGLEGVDHRVAHTTNLRIKQLLAYGALAYARPAERRTPAEARATAAHAALRADMRTFLAGYGLAGMLEVDWLDGPFSAIWPFIERMSEVKERDPSFLPQAQQLVDAALDEHEQIATAAAKML